MGVKRGAVQIYLKDDLSFVSEKPYNSNSSNVARALKLRVHRNSTEIQPTPKLRKKSQFLHRLLTKFDVFRLRLVEQPNALQSDTSYDWDNQSTTIRSTSNKMGDSDKK